MHRIIRFVLCLAAAAGFASAASAQTKLLRFPDIYGDKVVFTYAGDLWTAPSAAGGTATRLTAHPGLELFAKFSPDGKWIAFTGQYDGDEQVYVIPATGGVPKQLTFYPGPRTLPAALGVRQPGLRLDARTASRSSSARCATAGITATAASTPCRWTAGSGEPLPMPLSGGADLLAGRQAGRLHPLRPRLPHLEALPGGLGPGPLDLRPRHPRDEEDHRHPAHRARSDVDRRQDLLRLGPHRHPQPLLLRPGERGHDRSSPRARSGTSAGPAPTRTARSPTR